MRRAKLHWTYGGRQRSLDTKVLQEFDSVIGAAAWLLVQLEIPLATVDHVIKMARNYGVSVILNPAPAVHCPIVCLPAWMCSRQTKAS